MASKWQGTTFAHDNDGKVAAKFNRLMGIKGAPEQGKKSQNNCQSVLPFLLPFSFQNAVHGG